MAAAVVGVGDGALPRAGPCDESSPVRIDDAEGFEALLAKVSMVPFRVHPDERSRKEVRLERVDLSADGAAVHLQLLRELDTVRSVQVEHAPGTGIAPRLPELTHWMQSSATTSARVGGAGPASMDGTPMMSGGRFEILHPQFGRLASDVRLTAGTGGAGLAGGSVTLVVAPRLLPRLSRLRERIEDAVQEAVGSPVVLQVRAGAAEGELSGQG
jgi:hypothetical protein